MCSTRNRQISLSICCLIWTTCCCSPLQKDCMLLLPPPVSVCQSVAYTKESIKCCVTLPEHHFPWYREQSAESGWTSHLTVCVASLWSDKAADHLKANLSSHFKKWTQLQQLIPSLDEWEICEGISDNLSPWLLTTYNFLTYSEWRWHFWPAAPANHSGTPHFPGQRPEFPKLDLLISADNNPSKEISQGFF